MLKMQETAARRKQELKKNQNGNQHGIRNSLLPSQIFFPSSFIKDVNQKLTPNDIKKLIDESLVKSSSYSLSDVWVEQNASIPLEII